MIRVKSYIHGVNHLNIEATFRRLMYHILLWSVYVFYEVFVILILDPARIHPHQVFIGFMSNAAVFYITSDLVLRKYTRTNHWLIPCLGIIAVIAGYLAVSAFLTVVIYPLFPGNPVSTLPNNFIVERIWRGGYFVMLGFAYWFARRMIHAETRERQLEVARLNQELKVQQLQRDVAVSNLAFLKAQISPHFLHNTLAFFHSNINPLSPELARAMLKLSEIMRYALDTTDEQGKGSLEDEFQYIENYIHLNQLRFNGTLQIKYTVEGMIRFRRISSMVLITLVENAFKYGDLHDSSNPLQIDTLIANDSLIFRIQNKKAVKPVIEQRSGIGLQNIRERLSLAYGDNYRLQIEENKLTYTCTLNLIL